VDSGGFGEILKVWSSDVCGESLQQLSSNHKDIDTRTVLSLVTQLLGFIMNVMCCAATQIFSSSFLHNKISVKKFECSHVHPKQRKASWPTLKYLSASYITMGQAE